MLEFGQGQNNLEIDFIPTTSPLRRKKSIKFGTNIFFLGGG